MRLLAIETATAVTAVAVDEDGSTTEVVVDDQRRHTEVLAPAIATLLEGAGWRAQDLDGVVVDVGPGLFTGLRVGVATAKGLSVATGVGLFAVTSTDALAAAACDAGLRGTVVAVVDARRHEVFSATFDCGEGGFTATGDVALDTPDALAERLGALRRPVTLVGDGAVRHRGSFPASCAVHGDLAVPSPGAAARLVQRRAAAGQPAARHEDVHPWYVREADAVANFAIRGPAA